MQAGRLSLTSAVTVSAGCCPGLRRQVRPGTCAPTAALVLTAFRPMCCARAALCCATMALLAACLMRVFGVKQTRRRPRISRPFLWRLNRNPLRNLKVTLLKSWGYVVFLVFRAHIGRKTGETGHVSGGSDRLWLGCGKIRLPQLRGRLPIRFL